MTTLQAPQAPVRASSILPALQQAASPDFSSLPHAYARSAPGPTLASLSSRGRQKAQGRPAKKMQGATRQGAGLELVGEAALCLHATKSDV